MTYSQSLSGLLIECVTFFVQLFCKLIVALCERRQNWRRAAYMLPLEARSLSAHKRDWKMRRTISGQAALFCLFFVILATTIEAVEAAMATQAQQEKSCSRELQHSDKTLSAWAKTMEEMMSDARLPDSQPNKQAIHAEANGVLDAIEAFHDALAVGGAPRRPVVELARELVALRRRASAFALAMYLNSVDMRWPTHSMQMGVIVERVEQACLDRKTIIELEAPPQELTRQDAKQLEKLLLQSVGKLD